MALKNGVTHSVLTLTAMPSSQLGSSDFTMTSYDISWANQPRNERAALRN